MAVGDVTLGSAATPVVSIDQTNSYVGINNAAPTQALDLVGLGQFVASDAATTTTSSALRIKHLTSGNMADGFGARALFSIEDSAASNNNIAGIVAVRAGADGTGDLVFQTATAGTLADAVTIKSTGKVGFGTSTVPHGGVGMAKIAIEGANGSSSGPHVQFTTATDDYPLLQVLPYTHDDIEIQFDCYYDGAYRASHSSSPLTLAKSGSGISVAVGTAAGAGNVSTFTNVLTVSSLSRVGIGTTSPTYKLEVKEDTASTYAAQVWHDGDNANRWALAIAAGKDTPSSNGDCVWIDLLDGNGSGIAHIQYSTVAPNAAFVAFSDERLKENIQPTRLNGLDIITGLSLVEYDWKDPRRPRQEIGYIAQQAQQVYPPMVHVGTDEDKLLSLGDACLVPVLVKAIQELTARLEALEGAKQ